MHDQKKTTQEQDMSSEEYDYNPTLSEEFLKDYRLNEIRRREALHETETSYNAAAVSYTHLTLPTILRV